MLIKINKIENEVAVDESGCRYLINDDSRGINEKIWLNKEGGDVTDSFLIKYATRKPGTLSDLNLYNEVVCSKICDQLKLDHVNYEFCEITDTDGSVKKGVICPTYRETPRQVEINGRSLHDFYRSWFYDNNFGKIPNIEINTVYTYIEQLKSRFESRKMIMSDETEQRLTDELLTLALFDFCTCQIDRHWGNVGWINNNLYDDSRFKIKLAPIYDNECSFLLDEATPESLAKLVENINSPKKRQQAIDTVNKKRYNSPYLGVKTSLVREKEDRAGFLVPLPNGERNMSNAAVFAEEIAHEIHNRPHMREVYERFAAFDIEKFLNESGIIPESLPELKDIYSFVWNTRFKLLQKELEKGKNTQKGENQNETGLSSL